jgi:hypothetical protein
MISQLFVSFVASEKYQIDIVGCVFENRSIARGGGSTNKSVGVCCGYDHQT